jgi:hypothetical protein
MLSTNAGVGGTASASLELDYDFGAIADHPQVKICTELVGMDVSMI